VIRSSMRPVPIGVTLALLFASAVCTGDVGGGTATGADVSLHDFLKNSRPKESYCGVTCVYVVLRELGANKSYSEILVNMPPGIYGNTMDQITDFLRRDQGLDVHAVQCRAQELRHMLAQSPGQKAIANLYGHWVAIQGTEGKAFQIVDYPQKYFMPVETIEKYWEGYAVIVAKRPLLPGWRTTGAGLMVLALLGLVTALVLKYTGLTVRTRVAST